jgi:hypothetical protein
MFLSAQAWFLRERARREMAAGEYSRAWELAFEAQEIQRTAAGERLLAASKALVG